MLVLTWYAQIFFSRNCSAAPLQTERLRLFWPVRNLSKLMASRTKVINRPIVNHANINAQSDNFNMLAAVEIIGQTLTTDVWTSYDDPMSEIT